MLVLMLKIMLVHVAHRRCLLASSERTSSRTFHKDTQVIKGIRIPTYVHQRHAQCLPRGMRPGIASKPRLSFPVFVPTFRTILKVWSCKKLPRWSVVRLAARQRQYQIRGLKQQRTIEHCLKQRFAVGRNCNAIVAFLFLSSTLFCAT
jgi:hypothetical protein